MQNIDREDVESAVPQFVTLSEKSLQAHGELAGVLQELIIVAPASKLWPTDQKPQPVKKCFRVEETQKKNRSQNTTLMRRTA